MLPTDLFSKNVHIKSSQDLFFEVFCILELTETQANTTNFESLTVGCFRFSGKGVGGVHRQVAGASLRGEDGHT